jgi:hypothetical protein
MKVIKSQLFAAHFSFPRPWQAVPTAFVDLELSFGPMFCCAMQKIKRRAEKYAGSLQKTGLGCKLHQGGSEDFSC